MLKASCFWDKNKSKGEILKKLVFLIFILSVESFAMDQSLQQLFKSSEFKEGEFSILIQGDETKNSYELNSNNSRIPASLSKLVVAGMAYHYLEPNFVWTTKLYLCLNLKMKSSKAIFVCMAVETRAF